MDKGLWNKDYSFLIIASAFGAIGGIAGGFAISFLVFDETKSPLAAAISIALQLVPSMLLPIAISPIMDRIPRKRFLVAGDALAGLIYFIAGFYLMNFKFSYIAYLSVSLLLACIGTIDDLAYTSIFPLVIPKGFEQKGYAVSTMLYPVLKVIMMPLAAVLLDTIGVALILIGQGALSLLAAIVESRVKVIETVKSSKEAYSFKAWASDIKEAYIYLKNEKGLKNIYAYQASANGAAIAYQPLMVAVFRTMPGLSAAMFSFLSVAEFLGRSFGSAIQYKIKIPNKKKFSIIYGVYRLYEIMDIILLWIPYPFMLINRALCGFLGNNSAIIRESAVQRYIPNTLRARINAFNGALITLVGFVVTLAIGIISEFVDYRVCVSALAFLTLLAAYVFVGRNKRHISQMFESLPETK